MALNAIHATLDHGMMLREIELCLSLQVALKTGRRIFAGVYDEFASSAPGLDMLAAGTVTRFTACLACQFGRLDIDARMRTGGEHPGNIGVTVEAGSITDVSCPRDLGRCENGSRECRAGIEQASNAGDQTKRGDQGQCSLRLFQSR